MPRLEAEERIKMLLAALRSTNASLDLNTIGELTGTKPSTVRYQLKTTIENDTGYVFHNGKVILKDDIDTAAAQLTSKKKAGKRKKDTDEAAGGDDEVKVPSAPKSANNTNDDDDTTGEVAIETPKTPTAASPKKRGRPAKNKTESTEGQKTSAKKPRKSKAQKEEEEEEEVEHAKDSEGNELYNAQAGQGSEAGKPDDA